MADDAEELDKSEETEEQQEDEESSPKKGGGKKKAIIIIIALLVVIAIAVPAVLFLTGMFDKKSTSEDSELGEDVSAAIYYDMEEFIVNLNVGSKRPSFLKMTVSLEVATEAQVLLIERSMPRVRDSFQIYLRELRLDDLQGSAGLYRLREELLLRVNKAVYPAKVHDILFKEVLVQ